VGGKVVTSFSLVGEGEKKVAKHFIFQALSQDKQFENFWNSDPSLNLCPLPAKSTL